jgi:hypothetical protein
VGAPPVLEPPHFRGGTCFGGEMTMQPSLRNTIALSLEPIVEPEAWRVAQFLNWQESTTLKPYICECASQSIFCVLRPAPRIAPPPPDALFLLSASIVPFTFLCVSNRILFCHHDAQNILRRVPLAKRAAQLIFYNFEHTRTAIKCRLPKP